MKELQCFFLLRSEDKLLKLMNLRTVDLLDSDPQRKTPNLLERLNMRVERTREGIPHHFFVRTTNDVTTRHDFHRPYIFSSGCCFCAFNCICFCLVSPFSKFGQCHFIQYGLNQFSSGDHTLLSCFLILLLNCNLQVILGWEFQNLQLQINKVNIAILF